LIAAQIYNRQVVESIDVVAFGCLFVPLDTFSETIAVQQ